MGGRGVGVEVGNGVVVAVGGTGVPVGVAGGPAHAHVSTINRSALRTSLGRTAKSKAARAALLVKTLLARTPRFPILAYSFTPPAVRPPTICFCRAM